MKTSVLWETVSSLRNTRSRNEKQKEIEYLMEAYTPNEVYWAMRLLVQNPLESWDNNMGVGKKTVRKAAEQAYNIPYDEIRDKEKETGNLSDIFVDLEPRQSLSQIERPEREQISVEELVQFKVNEVSHASGNNLISLIAQYLEQYEDPQVFSYAILGDISLGMSHKTVLKALVNRTKYTRDELDRAYGLNPDVSRMVRDIAEGKGIRTEPALFDRISPQLASSKDIDDSGDWVGQYKYDGARILIHHEVGDNPHGGEYERTEAFTRQQNTVTKNLPELEEVDWPERSFIVDGEAVAYDPETGEPLEFQRIMERFQREKNIEEKRSEVDIRFKLFDIIACDTLNNGSLIDCTEKPYIDRLNIVRDLFPREMVVNSGHDLEQMYVDALDKGHEGIIAKDLRSTYVFGRDSSWRKKKPVKEPVDLRVSDVIRGTGKFKNSLGSIKLETKDGEYVGKVGTGFTDSDRDSLWSMHMDGNLVGSIIELEFEELQKTDHGWGLRFPRYITLRPEGEADDLERVKEL